MNNLNMSRLANNALLSFSSFTVSISSSLMLALLVPRYLSPAIFGVYSTLNWLLGVGTALTTLGFGAALRRFVAMRSGALDYKGASSLTIFSTLLTVIFAGIAAIVCWFGSAVIGHILGIPTRYLHIIPLIGVGILVGALVNIWTEVLTGIQHYRDLLNTTIVRSIIVIIATGLCLTLKGDLIWLITAGILGNAAGMVILLYRIRHSPISLHVRLHLPKERAFLTYAGYAAIITVIDIVVWQRSEIFFLSRYGDSTQVGHYGFAYSLVSLVTLGLSSMANVLTPHLANLRGAGKSVYVQQTYTMATRFLTIVALPIAAVGLALANVIIPTVLSPNYAAAVPVFQVLLVGGVVGAISMTNSSLIYATGTHYIIVLLGIPLALLNIGLDLVLIPSFGAYGAAWANTSTQVLAVSIAIAYVIKRHGVRFPFVACGKILLASVLLYFIIMGLVMQFTPVVAIIVGVIAAGPIYFILLLLMREFTAYDRQLLLQLRMRLWSLLPIHVTTSLAETMTPSTTDSTNTNQELYL